MLEFLILLLAFKQRRQVVCHHRRVRRALERGEQRIDRIGLLRVRGVLRRARRDRVGREGGEVGVRVVQPERLLEALLQPLEEEQRPAEEEHVALDLAALRKARDRLSHDRLKDGGGHVLLARALVEERLDVRLG